MPPAATMSIEPLVNESKAIMAAFIPDPHILLTVVQPAASGRPAPRDAWRAGAWPWPAGSTQPMITSRTSSGRSFARSTAARIAAAPSSGAAKLLSSPWKPPIGVRARATMTTGSFSMRVSLGRYLVGAHELSRARDDVFGKGNCLARLRVDRYAGEDADRRDLAGHGVAHLVHEPGDLLADLEERRAHGDGVACEQLALVGDVLLDRRHAAPVLLQERRGHAHLGEQVPGRLV